MDRDRRQTDSAIRRVRIARQITEPHRRRRSEIESAAVIDRPPDDAEWLESDALGGFASGTVAGYRTRRYHALLLVARHPPSDRVAMVNGVEAWIELGGERMQLSTQHYMPDVFYPRGMDRIIHFSSEPWPKWAFRLVDGVTVVHEIVVDRSDGDVLLAWHLIGSASGATLCIRPLLA